MGSVNAIERRREIAGRAAEQYAANPAVAAVLLAGSVARGLADDLSDIELDIYWRRPPTDDDRGAAIRSVGGDRVYAEVDEHEWADGYRIDGVKIDASNFLTSTIDDYLRAALQDADTEPELQVRITALLHGHAFHGADAIGRWRDRCSMYPTSLALAMAAKGLALRPLERLEMLVARDDVLLLHRDLLDNLQGLLDALFGLNRVFTPHPFHKWLEWEATLIPLKPDDLVPRIRRLLSSAPKVAVREVCALAEETFDLVAAHLPEFRITPVRDAFAFRRTT
jgi:hypothetical protein